MNRYYCCSCCLLVYFETNNFRKSINETKLERVHSSECNYKQHNKNINKKSSSSIFFFVY